MVIYVCATFVPCTLYIVSIICTVSLALNTVNTGDFQKVSLGMFFFVSLTTILLTKHNYAVVNKFIFNNYT